MCKETLCMVMVVAMVGAVTYIALNETGKLDKVKRQCYNKVMDFKDDIKENLKEKLD